MSKDGTVKKKAEDLMATYTSIFEKYGIKCTIFQRYREEEVGAQSHMNGDLLANLADKANEGKEKKIFHFQKNQYKLLVLSFKPIEKGTQKNYREYAFVLEKTERWHYGLKPRSFVANEEKILSDIEHRLKKMINKAQKKSMSKVCFDGPTDLIRYLFCKKYIYKTNLLGKERSFWDWFMAAIGLVAIFLIVLILVFCF